MARTVCKAITRLEKNMGDVDRLLEIHEDISGDARGRRYGVEVLNKSGVLLVTACWEAFIEDLADESFEILIKRARSASVIPRKVKSLAAKPLREEVDPTKVWLLADRGWKTILQTHSSSLKQKHIGTFNTPKPANIDRLFESLIGLRSLSSNWRWRGMKVSTARSRLTDYVEDRGAIAHRVRTKTAITKDYVRKYRRFVYILAVKSTNHVNNYLKSVVGRQPWLTVRFGRTR